MQLQATSIPGVFELALERRSDVRGFFVKVLQRSELAEAGIGPLDFVEEYYTYSHKGVVRGMHFQTPPHDHVKLVYCSAGSVIDVLVDIRVGSPAFGVATVFELGAERGNALLVPPGVAHGFCTPTEPATMHYAVTTEYAPSHDAGVRWDSIGMTWPVAEPVMSDRDRTLPALADYDSPFRWEPQP